MKGALKQELIEFFQKSKTFSGLSKAEKSSISYKVERNNRHNLLVYLDETLQWEAEKNGNGGGSILLPYTSYEKLNRMRVEIIETNKD